MTDEPTLPFFAPAVRRDATVTSIAAAEAVAKVTGKIAASVLRFINERGSYGATDDEIKDAHPEAPESSYRKRRTELAKAGFLIDSGRTRTNRYGRECIVWIAANTQQEGIAA